ncbi:YxeA family protein [Alkalicoccobacillus porphyridii]|uniref:YxeA family protein n=1 Tax=Alkalicoccobacillus porphyridii TaxID=2597270 RepID=A0A554A0S8_9BACI|nr:YxeA family protein [Alkalicoccobacillus porphyridii]TSB47299.1 YxeA family protein [Alkalicoccobacillus porphyridii]
MKKAGLTLVFIIVMAIAGYMIFNMIQQEDYYVKIVDGGEATADVSDENERSTHNYVTLGITEDGEGEIIEFMGLKQLRQGAYLTVKMNGDRAITYEEVDESDVPSEVKERLDDQ